MRRLALVVVACLWGGQAVAVERSPKAEKPSAAKTDEDRFLEMTEAYGALLEEGYRARKAGKPFSNEEFERRVKALGGHPDWGRMKQRNDLGTQPMPPDMRDFPF
jgi:hypothetical protein